MPNPVIIFFDKQRAANDGWTWPDNLGSLPVGLADGSFVNPSEVEAAYELLLLDDTRSVKEQLPNAMHSNKNLDEILLVVTHRNSSLNATPAGDEILQSWGKPRSVKDFSHVKNDEVFTNIINVLSGSGADNFLAKLRDDQCCRCYEVLAAVCNLKILSPGTPDNEVNDYIDEVMWILPLEVKREWMSCQDMGGNRDWNQSLNMIRDKAEPLLS